MQQERAIKAEFACRLCCRNKIKWIKKKKDNKRCLRKQSKYFPPQILASGPLSHFNFFAACISK